MSDTQHRTDTQIEKTKAKLVELISMDVLKSDTTEDPRAVEIVDTLRQLMMLEACDFTLKLFQK